MISFLLPTLNRPKRLTECLDSIKATTHGFDVEIVIAAEDNESLDIGKQYGAVCVLCPPQSGLEYAVNIALANSTGEMIVMAADDVRFLDGWLAEALRVMGEMPRGGMVALSDGHSKPDEFAAHWLATRQGLKEVCNGVAFIPHYHAWYCDMEMSLRFRIAGRYRAAMGAKIDHLHPFWGTAKVDATYEKGYMANSKTEADRKTFVRRWRQNFPDDFTSVIG